MTIMSPIQWIENEIYFLKMILKNCLPKDVNEISNLFLSPRIN